MTKYSKHIKVILLILILVIATILWYYFDDISSIFRSKPVSQTTSKPVNQAQLSDQSSKGNSTEVDSFEGDESITSISQDKTSLVSKTESSVQQSDSSEAQLEKIQSLINLQDVRDPFENLFKKSEQQRNEQSKTTEKPLEAPKDDEVQHTKEPEVIPYPNEDKPDPTDQDVTYEDLLKQLTGQRSIAQVIEPPVEPEVILPPVILKGVVAQGAKRKAILLYKAQSFIVDTGGKIDEWVINDISENRVYLSNEKDQFFILTLEGVIIDENKK